MKDWDYYKGKDIKVPERPKDWVCPKCEAIINIKKYNFCPVCGASLEPSRFVICYYQ